MYLLYPPTCTHIYPPTCTHIYTNPQFYFAINSGAAIAYLVIAYVCQYGAGPASGGQEWGFFWGFLIVAAYVIVLSEDCRGLIMLMFRGLGLFTLLMPACRLVSIHPCEVVQ